MHKVVDAGVRQIQEVFGQFSKGGNLSGAVSLRVFWTMCADLPSPREIVAGLHRRGLNSLTFLRRVKSLQGPSTESADPESAPKTAHDAQERQPSRFDVHTASPNGQHRVATAPISPKRKRQVQDLPSLAKRRKATPRREEAKEDRGGFGQDVAISQDESSLDEAVEDLAKQPRRFVKHSSRVAILTLEEKSEAPGSERYPGRERGLPRKRQVQTWLEAAKVKGLDTKRSTSQIHKGLFCTF